MRTALILASVLACPLLCGAAILPGTAPRPNAWEKELKGIAAGYTKYGRVDQIVRWAPEDCRSPGSMPPTMRYSKSSDGATHGQKLYTVFAKHKDWEGGRFSHGQTYLPPRLKEGDGKQRGPVPVGQVIVKESWVPVAVTLEQLRADPQSPVNLHDGGKVTPADRTKGEHLDQVDFGTRVQTYAYHPPARKWFKADKKGDLFIMFKVDPDTPDTDQGWVYGTVTADGRKVTASGKIASCMSCHQQAPHDRLFGMKE